MRLLVVSPWCPWPPVNGSQQRLFYLLGELSRFHAITLLARGSEPDAVRALADRCHAMELFPATPRRTARGSWLTPVPRALANDHDPRLQDRVDALVPSHDASIAFQLGAVLYLDHHRRLPRLFEELEVSVIRDRSLHAAIQTRLRNAATWWKLARFARRLVATFDHTTVVSADERNILVRIGCDPARVSIVPNAVPDSLTERPLVQPVAGRLIYPGAVTFDANLDAVQWFCRTTLPLIAERVAEVSLRVTGSVDGVDPRELPAGPDVVFTGQLDDIDAEIASSVVCVVPLREGGGTRLKVLRALALGTPVVSTSKGVEGLALEPDHDVLIGDTPEAFASAVCRLLQDDGLRRSLAGRGRDVIRERFLWSRSGHLLGQALEHAAQDWARRHTRRAGHHAGAP
jgi:glycosyltransferase involved in cell wall biosynthesis